MTQEQQAPTPKPQAAAGIIHFSVLMGVLLLVALGFRCVDLGTRPIHHDEAVNASILRPLWETNRYTYDPAHFHGPSLYYAAQAALKLQGAPDYLQWRESMLRMAPAVIGAVLVLLVLLFTDGLGLVGTLAAAAFMAVSPAMVYYSRDFIHEMLLVFSTALMLGAVWRWMQTTHVIWAVLAGAGLGLMMATKETFVIAVAAMLAAAILTWRWESGPKMPRGCTALPQFRPHLFVMIAVTLGVVVALFSSLFSNWQGLLDAPRALVAWTGKASGSHHVHPWNFYFERLLWYRQAGGPVWSEAAIGLMALIGAGVAVTSRMPSGIDRSLARFLTLYTVLQAAAYALIPYKTPWCSLGFWFSTILLAGAGFGMLWAWLSHRVARVFLALVLIAALGHLGWQAWQTSFARPCDPANPYAYSETTPNEFELAQRICALAGAHPDRARMPVMIVAQDSGWPLPWHLRGLQKTGWWEQFPPVPIAPVVVVSSQLGPVLEERTGGKWVNTGMYELRTGVWLQLHVEKALWNRFLETRGGTASPAKTP